MHGLWAVCFRPEGLPADKSSLDWHAFLLLSMGDESKVLRTGEELDELQPSDSEFILASRTVAAGNLLSCSRIVQVRIWNFHPPHGQGHMMIKLYLAQMQALLGPLLLIGGICPLLSAPYTVAASLHARRCAPRACTCCRGRRACRSCS